MRVVQDDKRAANASQVDEPGSDLEAQREGAGIVDRAGAATVITVHLAGATG